MKISVLSAFVTAIQLVAGDATLVPAAGGQVKARDSDGNSARVGPFTGDVAFTGERRSNDARDVRNSAGADPFTGDVAFPGEKRATGGGDAPSKSQPNRGSRRRPVTPPIPTSTGSPKARRDKGRNSVSAEPFTGDVAFPGEKRATGSDRNTGKSNRNTRPGRRPPAPVPTGAARHRRDRVRNSVSAEPFTGDVAFPGEKRSGGIQRLARDRTAGGRDGRNRADPFTGDVAFPGDKRVRDDDNETRAGRFEEVVAFPGDKRARDDDNETRAGRFEEVVAFPGDKRARDDDNETRAGRFEEVVAFPGDKRARDGERNGNSRLPDQEDETRFRDNGRVRRDEES